MRHFRETFLRHIAQSLYNCVHCCTLNENMPVSSFPCLLPNVHTLHNNVIFQVPENPSLTFVGHYPLPVAGLQHSPASNCAFRLQGRGFYGIVLLIKHNFEGSYMNNALCVMTLQQTQRTEDRGTVEMLKSFVFFRHSTQLESPSLVGQYKPKFCSTLLHEA